MKYTSLTTEKKNIYNQLLCQSILIATENDRNLSSFGFKMLLISNGTGILVLLSLLSALIEKQGINGASVFLGAIFFFFVGLLSAAAQYWIVMVVSADAVRHTADQVTNVINDSINVEEMQGYGFNEKGRRYFFRAGIISAIAFGIGAVLSFIFLSIQL